MYIVKNKKMDEIAERLIEIRDELESSEDIEEGLMEIDQLIAELQSGYF